MKLVVREEDEGDRIRWAADDWLWPPIKGREGKDLYRRSFIIVVKSEYWGVGSQC